MYFPDVPKLDDWKKFTGRPRFSTVQPAPEMKKLDQLIEQYHQVMPMARINTLVDLKPAIIAWQQKNPRPPVNKLAAVPEGDPYGAVNALGDVVGRKLKTAVPSTSPYNKVVCLGYSIKTGTLRAYVSGRADWQHTANGYIGDADPDIDLQNRCAQMKEAIQKAHVLYNTEMLSKHVVTDDAKTLKIFMAPEFFFRGHGGAFTMDYLMGVQPKTDGTPGKTNILDEMRKETGKPAYKDWLFVLGTFVAGTERNSAACQDCLKWLEKPNPSTRDSVLACPGCQSKLRCKFCPGPLIVKTTGAGPHWFVCKNCLKQSQFMEYCTGVDIDNYAMVQKGGYSSGDGIHDYSVLKAYVSGFDFDYVDGDASKIKVFGRQEKFSEPRNNPGSASERKGGSVFTMDGIHYGLEVCLDHLAGRLANDGDRGAIQIQLVPSAGASITPTSVVGGIVFNVDGADPRVSVMVKELGVATTKSRVGFLGVDEKGAGLFPAGNQMVEIFGLFAIPAA
jgi:hypothetical protein